MMVVHLNGGGAAACGGWRTGHWEMSDRLEQVTCKKCRRIAYASAELLRLTSIDNHDDAVTPQETT